MSHWIWCEIHWKIPILTETIARSILVSFIGYHIQWPVSQQLFYYITNEQTDKFPKIHSFVLCSNFRSNIQWKNLRACEHQKYSLGWKQLSSMKKSIFRLYNNSKYLLNFYPACWALSSFDTALFHFRATNCAIDIRRTCNIFTVTVEHCQVRVCFCWKFWQLLLYFFMRARTPLNLAHRIRNYWK